MNEKLKSQNTVTLLNITSTIIVAGINFFTIPIFTRLLSTDSYGVVSLYTTWVQIFTVFIGLKCDGSIASAQANLPKEDQDSYQYSIMLLAVLSFSVLGVLSLCFLTPLSELVGLEQIVFVAMLIQSFGGFIISFFNMRFIFRKEALFNLLLSVGLCAATTLLSIALILVLPELDYLGRIIGLMIPSILIGICLFISLLKKRPGFRIQYWKFCLPLTLPLIFHGLSQLVLSQVNKIALQSLCGFSEVGIFSLGVTIAGLIGMIYNALNNAYVPLFYEDLSDETRGDLKRKHFFNYLVLFTGGTCAFMFLSPEILKIMSSESYYAALDYLPLLIIGQFCTFLYSFPVNYEFYLKKTISIAIGTTMAAVENIILSLLFIPVYGMTGAAIACLLSYFSLFMFQYLIARFKHDDKNFAPRYYFGSFFVVSIVGLLSCLLAPATLLRWAIGLLFVVVVFARCIKRRRIF